MVTSCGGTNFKPRKGKRQYRVPSIGHRWTEFRWQAQRCKISVDMTEHHYMTLIKQPCGYCGKRQPDTKYTNSNCRYHWISIAWLKYLRRVCPWSYTRRIPFISRISYWNQYYRNKSALHNGVNLKNCNWVTLLDPRAYSMSTVATESTKRCTITLGFSTEMGANSKHDNWNLICH